VILNVTLGCLALLSFVLMLWQWWVARGFPLHRRLAAPVFGPGLTLLKPLKGCDEATEGCLRSWLVQSYRGDREILFGVAWADDPVCAIVRKLLKEFSGCDARLVVCGPLEGANLKVCKLAQLERSARYDVIVVSDADVRVPPDFLANAVAPLEAPAVGLVNCFYRLANPTTFAMRWEAVAVNADFWSQVLQSRSLKPLDFALGAVMLVRRSCLREIGGFASLTEVLADDYQLGNRIARRGHRIDLCPVVVECCSGAMGWSAVWKHQLRWARTIRVCQPMPYFFSLLSNPTLWPLLWAAVCPTVPALLFGAVCLLARVAIARDLQRRLMAGPDPSPPAGLAVSGSIALAKDLFQVPLWLLAFTGNRIEWRGERMHLRADGTMVKD